MQLVILFFCISYARLPARVLTYIDKARRAGRNVDKSDILDIFGDIVDIFELTDFFGSSGMN